MIILIQTFNMIFPDYDQTPSSHSKRTVVIKTVETRDGEVQSRIKAELHACVGIIMRDITAVLWLLFQFAKIYFFHQVVKESKREAERDDRTDKDDKDTKDK